MVKLSIYLLNSRTLLFFLKLLVIEMVNLDFGLYLGCLKLFSYFHQPQKSGQMHVLFWAVL